MGVLKVTFRRLCDVGGILRKYSKIPSGIAGKAASSISDDRYCPLVPPLAAKSCYAKIMFAAIRYRL